jgi:hypothetical protein
VSKYDGEIRAAGEVCGKLQDLLGKAGDPVRSSADGYDAMALFLSGDEGWRDAGKTLRGAFARPARAATGLSKGLDK